MAESVRHTDVLIVGAGPSGLMMAAQLLRFGIQPTIVDAKSGPDRTPKSMAIPARSLELFRQIGLADALLDSGNPAHGVQLQRGRKQIGGLDFSLLDQPGTAFPFAYFVGQDQAEKLLIDRLTEKACPVRWETKLVALRQDDQRATVELEHEGEIEQWTCKWVVGADGADGTVRKYLHIPFEGKVRSDPFFVADVELNGADHRQIHFFVSKRNVFGVFPYGSGRYRLTGPVPAGSTTEKAAVDEAVGFELPVKRYISIRRFFLHTRMAETFSRQRCFLIGDAAHIQLSVGGPGLNNGIPDAANLAWKLAGVLLGHMEARILHTYTEERLPAAKATVRSVDRAFRWVKALSFRFTPRLDFLMARAIRRVHRNPRWLTRIFTDLAQLNIHYRQATLAVHYATGRRIQAGDRLPFLAVYDEKAKKQTDLHRWCEKPGFVLLLLGTVGSHALHVVGQWIRQKYPRAMHLYYLPFSSRNLSVFEAFEVKPEGTKVLVIRPDMHIGYLNDVLNVNLIDTYMQEAVGWIVDFP